MTLPLKSLHHRLKCPQSSVALSMTFNIIIVMCKMCALQNIFLSLPHHYLFFFLRNCWMMNINDVIQESSPFLSVLISVLFFFSSISRDILIGRSNDNTAIQIVLSGDIQSWNVSLPVMLLFLPFCEWHPPPSRCTQWAVCESLSCLTSDLSRVYGLISGFHPCLIGC